MDIRQGRGSLIDGVFVLGDGEVVASADPARGFEPVFETRSGLALVDDAIAAANLAQPKWAALTSAARVEALMRLKGTFDARLKEIATAIVYETGKPHREATGEARSLGARITLTAEHGLRRIEPLVPEGVKGQARAHAQGVLVVVGPYNYPAHLLNAHVIPALMTGNTVVIKPTEHCPWVGELYAACAISAGLPAGVLNLVQGGGDVGAALVSHPDVHGVLFTGSFETGQRIARACLEQPWKIVALEMGGKNCAVILDDADLTQALAAVLQGAFLTAGQRCTATSRVLVERRVGERFGEALCEATRRLVPGDPWDDASAFGPLANQAAYDRFCKLRAGARAAGAEVMVPGEALGEGAFVTPSVHRLPAGVEAAPGYLDQELFGPDLCLEVVDDVDHAIKRLNALPFGLSNAVFTADDERFERVYLQTRSGLLNRNRSTNGASGQLPFGGLGRSGNQRPAGIDAVRYTTFPVAMMVGEPGEAPVEATFEAAFTAGDERFSIDTDRLLVRHDIEAALERYRIWVDDVAGAEVHVLLTTLQRWRRDGEPLTGSMWVAALGEGARTRGRHLVLTAPKDISPENGGARPALLDRLESMLKALAASNADQVTGHGRRQVQLPEGGRLPRSDAYLRRMYRGGFLPREKKQPVIDLSRSEGPVLRSVDDEPFAILDAASQIASLGLGFAPGAFSAALDEGRFLRTAIANPDTTVAADDDVDAYAALLTKQTHPDLKYVTWAAGGAEANERAFDLCRLHGPGGRRVIAFEGSFHGRTLVALHATHNPVKRAPFEFKGYEARYVPFPSWPDPRIEPEVTQAWLEAWAVGAAPEPKDAQEEVEIASLNALAAAIDEGDVCCVIIEPMQGEGGDNFATARFFSGLRALTRQRGVPLVFDEVQTGFGLGGPFFWHSGFALRQADGTADAPDCVTTAKKAQLGACISRWEDPRPAPAHALQALRGHIHASGIMETSSESSAAKVQDRLWQLALDRPALVLAPRNRGWAFAFDLPTKNLALQLVAQRFYRGFMVYVAGEKTVRFRLNATFSDADLARLFAGIEAGLDLLASSSAGKEGEAVKEGWARLKAPAWVDGAIERVDFAGGMLEDGGKEVRWLLALPPGPLERACDRAMKRSPLPSEQIAQGLAALFDRVPTERDGPELIRAAMHNEIAGLNDAAGWDRLEEKLGMTAGRLIVEALAARVIKIEKEDWSRWKEQVVAIEDATYEEGRRETEAELRAMVEGEGGLGLLAVRRSDTGLRAVGYAFGGPLEQYRADGPRDDVMNGKMNTFYSSNITIAADARGTGLGRRLKQRQVREVREIRDAQGQVRYAFMTSRNRIGLTAEMGAINRRLGAYEVKRYVGNQYGDVSGRAQYLRVPLTRPTVALAPTLGERALDWASSVQAPLGPSPQSVYQVLKRGDMTSALGTKLTLSNWTTPAMVRYVELLRELAPRHLKHAYFTSGQSELVDKGLRCLRVGRAGAQTVIGLQRQFLGTTTAAARSLSDPAGHAAPFAWFDWPLVPHPAEAGTDATLGAVMAIVNKVGADDVLGIVVELIGERSGLTLPEGFLEALSALRKDTGIPIVAVETASALGRGSDSLFMTDALLVRPNMVWWYAGAQLGHIFVDEVHYVGKPLTLISTWDGDEVSALRTREHLLAARQALAQEDRLRLEIALDAAGLVSGRRGRGLWQAFACRDQMAADKVLAEAAQQGLQLGRGLPGVIVLCPPIDVEDDEIERGVAILRTVLPAALRA